MAINNTDDDELSSDERLKALIPGYQALKGKPEDYPAGEELSSISAKEADEVPVDEEIPSISAKEVEAKEYPEGEELPEISAKEVEKQEAEKALGKPEDYPAGSELPEISAKEAEAMEAARKNPNAVVEKDEEDKGEEVSPDEIIDKEVPRPSSAEAAQSGEDEETASTGDLKGSNVLKRAHDSLTDDGKTINFGSKGTNDIEALMAGMQARSTQIFGAEMGKAMNRLGAAIARTTPANEDIYNDAIKGADQYIKEYQMVKDAQKDDPNSAYSQGLKDFAKKMYGINIQGNVSASELEKIVPLVGKEYDNSEARKLKQTLVSATIEAKHEDNAIKLKQHVADQSEKAITKQNSDFDKAEEQYTKSANQLESRRGALGDAKKTVQLSQKLNAMLNQYPDTNKVPPELVGEYASGFNNLITGGQASDVKLRKILPNNIPMEGSKIMEWISGNPHGAQQQAFLKAFNDSAQTQQRVAQGQLQEGTITNLKRYEGRLRPEFKQQEMTINNINPQDYDNFKVGNLTSAAQAPQGQVLSPASQAKIKIFRSRNPQIKSDDDAAKILKDKGYIQ